MIKYPVILEATSEGFWVQAPDVPGCVSFGETKAEALSNMREALEGHLGILMENGEPIPAASAAAEMLEITIGPP